MSDDARSPSVSIIVVNYNSGSLLTSCVEALLSTAADFQVLVADNGSIDDSLERLEAAIDDPRLLIHRNHENLGFAAGVNSVIARARGDYLLFLNPDCLATPEAIEAMVSVMESAPRVGMAGCLIRNPDGSEQPGCRRRVPTPWRTLLRVLRLDRLPITRWGREASCYMDKSPMPTQAIDVEAISGAFMLVRRAALDEVGLLDDGYFLHCEDLDWCMRFRHLGWRILFVPEVTITHFKGGCSQSCRLNVEWHKHRGMIRFYKKFFRHQYPAPLMFLVTVAVWSRFLLLASRLSLGRAWA